MLYNRDSDFTKVQTKIEAKNLDFLFLMGSFSKLPIFLVLAADFYF